MGHLRYLFAAAFFLAGAPVLWFGLSSGSPESALLGVLAIAVSVGITLPRPSVLRYLCAAILLANGAMICDATLSSGVTLWWLMPAAFSFAAAIGIIRHYRWARIAASIAAVVQVGSWTVVALQALPHEDLGYTIISLLPGLLFSAIWTWCVWAAFRVSNSKVVAA